MSFKVLTLIAFIPLSSLSLNAAPAPMKEKLSCKTPLPKNTKHIYEMRFVRRWGLNAAIQAFSVHHDTTPSDMERKKDCFTTAGWSQFNQALHQSGNITTIQQNQFKSHAMLTGDISTKKDFVNNTWTLQIPMNIVYQNEKTRITQNLNVHMLIGLKQDGHLGIMQLIGKPVELTPTTSSPTKS